MLRNVNYFTFALAEHALKFTPNIKSIIRMSADTSVYIFFLIFRLIIISNIHSNVKNKQVLATVNRFRFLNTPRAFDVGAAYLVMFERSINQQGRLLLHPLHDGMSHSIVGLCGGLSSGNAVLVIHILFGRPGRKGCHWME